VLRTRRGIPITLALLYIELATQVGPAGGGRVVPGPLPGQAAHAPGEVVIDPFTGQSLSREDLDERLLPYRRQRGLTGDFEAPLGLFLQAAPPRDVIARLLRNLKEIHRSAEDWPRLLAVLERLVVLLPEAWEERRDRGLVRAELGRRAAAADDLALLPAAPRPDADDAPALLRRLASCAPAAAAGTDPMRLMQQIPWPSGPSRCPPSTASCRPQCRRPRAPAAGAAGAPVYLWGPPAAARPTCCARWRTAAAGRASGGLVRRRHPVPWPLAADWSLVVIDRCEALDADAQHAAFALFVEAAAGVQWAAAGRLPPVDLPLREDLRTRLGWGHVFALQPLSEAETPRRLRREADRRGIFLSDDVMDHLLTRFRATWAPDGACSTGWTTTRWPRSRAITVPLLRPCWPKTPTWAGAA
jgi:hypothetical protein